MTPEQIVAKQVLDHITLFPEQFSMEDWDGKGTCGTTRCIAGWTVFLVDGVQAPDKHTPDGGVSADYYKYGNYCEDRGMELLGLRDSGLFYMEDDEALERLSDFVETGRW